MSAFSLLLPLCAFVSLCETLCVADAFKPRPHKTKARPEKSAGKVSHRFGRLKAVGSPKGEGTKTPRQRGRSESLSFPLLAKALPNIPLFQRRQDEQRAGGVV